MRPLTPAAHLTTTEQDLKTLGSYEGMASFAGGGPVGSTCGGCLFWGRRWKYDRAAEGWVAVYSSPGYGPDKEINPRRCHKAWMMTGERPIHGVPHYAAGCSQWQPNPEPPRIRRTRRGKHAGDAEGVQQAGAADAPRSGDSGADLAPEAGDGGGDAGPLGAA